MILELTLMIVSGLVIAGLLVHRHLELSRGLETRVKEVREKTDPVLRDIHDTTNKMFSYVTLHNTVLVLNKAFVHIVRFFMDISHQAHKVSAHLVEKASKKTEDLSRGGAASFYLKQIKESKDESQASAQSVIDSTGENK